MSRPSGKLLRTLFRVINILLVLLVFRILAGIVYEYQWYFPANFRFSTFLAGREEFFTGAYRIAFYSHIICGPFVILIGMFLFWSGNRMTQVSIHRLLGKIQYLLIAIVLVPSGLVMAPRAYTGCIAGIGFGLLSIATFVTATFAVTHIRHRRLAEHRRWASRLIILLLSPIALRVMSGLAITLRIESPESYQLSAWASWIVPILVFEAWLRTSKSENNIQDQLSHEIDSISDKRLDKAL